MFVDTHVTMLRFDRELAQPRYMAYLLGLPGARTYIEDALSVGATKQRELNVEALRKHAVRLLPLPDQKRVADFLDLECGRIAALRREIVAAKEVLEEYLMSTTHTLIAGGIGNAGRVGDTGLAWPRVIPPGWRLKKLKAVARMASGKGITSEEIAEEGSYIVYGGNGPRGRSDQWTHEGSHVLVGRQGALCGNVHRAGGRFWASEHALVATPNTGVDVSWLESLLRVMNLRQHSVSAAQPGLAADRILNLKVPVPPSEQQAAIAEKVTAATASVTPLRDELQAFANSIVDYRDALIAEAVAGRLDVQQPSEAELDEARHADEAAKPEALAG